MENKEETSLALDLLKDMKNTNRSLIITNILLTLALIIAFSIIILK